jgi:PAS domain S-box-containing protein
MSESRPILLRRADEAEPRWLDALAGLRIRSVEPTQPLEQLRNSLRDAACVLVDGGVSDATDRIRRACKADSSVQAVLVAPAAEHPRLTRAILFAPGIGEVWLRSPDQLEPGLVLQAGDLTRARRSYRQTESRIRMTLAALEAPTEHRAVVSDAYLAALLEVVPDPVISVDDAGVVQSWNPGAERVLGYARGEAVGRPLAEILRVGSGNASVLGEDASRLSVPTRREIRFRRKSGEEGVGELIVVPVEAGGQRIRAVIVHDLTAERRAQGEIKAQAVELEAQTEDLRTQAAELERVNEELHARTVALEHAAQARDRFYAAMSHELRTPINAILGFLDILLAGVYGPLAEKQEEGLLRAQRAARHLHELVNDVLDLARIEAGRMEMQVEVTPFPAVIQDVRETVLAMADQVGSELSIHGPVYHEIRTDPRRLRQILLNLLSNAIKFGRGLPIEVRWDVVEGNGVWIDVVDQGTGIDPAELDRIFDEFTIGSSPGAGTGLGLAISLRLADLLGGSVEASSVPGQGSTFRVTLPGLPPEESAADGDSTPPGQAGASANE